MSFFGFGRKRKAKKAEEAEEAKKAQARTDLSADPAPRESEERHHGPWDVSDPSIPDRPYVDLGVLKIPEDQSLQYRLGVDPDSHRVLSVTVTKGGSSLQMSVLAASRNEPLWDTVRERINQGEAPQEVDGVFGKEILVSVPVPSGAIVPTRIVGTDGPRWMLRGIFTGSAAREGGADKKDFDDYYSSVVVDRGQEPVAPMDTIALTMPSAPEEDDSEETEQENGAASVPSSCPNGPFVKGQDASQTQNILQRGDLFSEMR